MKKLTLLKWFLQIMVLCINNTKVCPYIYIVNVLFTHDLLLESQICTKAHTGRGTQPGSHKKPLSRA